MARVKAVMRRYSTIAQTTQQTNIVSGELVIDLQTYELFKKGKKRMIIIQVKEGLKTMSSKYNIYFSREEYNKLMQIKEIQETATERVEKMTKQLKLKSNLAENTKNTDMLYWVGMMNNFKNQAEEIIFNELIYVQERMRMKNIIEMDLQM